jgi:hypothetical protein
MERNAARNPLRVLKTANEQLGSSMTRASTPQDGCKACAIRRIRLISLGIPGQPAPQPNPTSDTALLHFASSFVFCLGRAGLGPER